ncbi:MAG: hypothetical protein IJX78_03450 [Bacilli bacterium]|nr:hypothetical protein [Bacilli bacterium]
MKYVDEILNNSKKHKIKVESGGAFISKGSTIAAGVTLVSEILSKQNSKNIIYQIKEDGDLLKRGDVLLSVRGAYGDIASIKNDCLNIFSELCGVSLAVQKFKQEIKDLDCQILFFQNNLPGLGEYYNQTIVNSGGLIISNNTPYLSANLWDDVDSMNELLDNLDAEDIFVEVRNIEEFNQLTVSKCTHIVCLNFTDEDLEYIRYNNNYKKIVIKNNMTFPSIRSFAKKGADYLIINNFNSQVKKFDIDFSYFTK